MEFVVGLVGVLPKEGQERTAGYPIEAALAEHPSVTDLRGRTSPMELAGALRAARACVTVDSGPLHVAAAVGCPTEREPDRVGAKLRLVPGEPVPERRLSQARARVYGWRSTGAGHGDAGARALLSRGATVGYTRAGGRAGSPTPSAPEE